MPPLAAVNSSGTLLRTSIKGGHAPDSPRGRDRLLQVRADQLLGHLNYPRFGIDEEQEGSS